MGGDEASKTPAQVARQQPPMAMRRSLGWLFWFEIDGKEREAVCLPLEAGTI